MYVCIIQGVPKPCYNLRSIFLLKLVFVAILTYSHDSWVITKKNYYLTKKRQRWNLYQEFTV